jgi:hypothetical protein
LSDACDNVPVASLIQFAFMLRVTDFRVDAKRAELEKKLELFDSEVSMANPLAATGGSFDDEEQGGGGKAKKKKKDADFDASPRAMSRE